MTIGKLLSILISGSAALVVACSDPLIYPYCTNIPAHGCPGGDGDASMNCVDPSCEAIYSRSADCVWTRVATCPARTDGGALDAGADSSGRGADAASIPDGPIRDVGFGIPDGAGGGAGCADLESPDCPLALALHCGGGSCCGCESLYVCSEGGWNLWGSCGDGGSIVPLAP